MKTKIQSDQANYYKSNVKTMFGASSSFDQFTFMDSLTNRTIAVRDIRKLGKKKSRPRGKVRASSQQVQIRQLDQCIDLLKSVTNFQKKNLRQKLYGKNQEEIERQQRQRELEGTSGAIQKRRLIRQLIAKSLSQRNKEELQKYLSNPRHRLDQQLVQLSKHNNLPICKENISKVVQALSKKEEGQKMKRKQMFDDFEKEPFVQKLSNLQKQMGRQLKEKLRKAGLFLIDNKGLKPRKDHKSPEFCNAFSQRVHKNPFQDIQWQVCSVDSSQIKKKIRTRKIGKVVESKLQELSDVIKGGALQDLQIAVQRNSKEILKQKDERGNNLLHICAQLGKGRMFEWLVSKRGVDGLLQKNNEGDTPIRIADRLGYREVLKHVPRSFL